MIVVQARDARRTLPESLYMRACVRFEKNHKVNIVDAHAGHILILQLRPQYLSGLHTRFRLSPQAPLLPPPH